MRRKTLSRPERFARFGLPVHMSETTLLSGRLMPPEFVDLNDYQVPEWPSTPDGEERQAEEVVRHYTTLVRHPAVRSITYWGLTHNGVVAWGTVRPRAGRWSTPKPACPRPLAPRQGRVVGFPTLQSSRMTRVASRFRVFAGHYRVRVGEEMAVVDP